MKKERSTLISSLLVGGKLLLICAIVAGIVSFVYALTEKPYEENVTEQKRQTISRIFASDAVSYTEAELSAEAEGIKAIYLVSENGALRGYCVEVLSTGFGGEMELMVGFDAAQNIIGVSTISHSETPGLGAPVMAGGDYLSQYTGKMGPLSAEDIDLVSGATISSRGVLAGVNRAAEAIKQLGGESRE